MLFKCLPFLSTDNLTSWRFHVGRSRKSPSRRKEEKDGKAQQSKCTSTSTIHPFLHLPTSDARTLKHYKKVQRAFCWRSKAQSSVFSRLTQPRELNVWKVYVRRWFSYKSAQITSGSDIWKFALDMWEQGAEPCDKRFDSQKLVDNKLLNDNRNVLSIWPYLELTVPTT